MRSLAANRGAMAPWIKEDAMNYRNGLLTSVAMTALGLSQGNG